MQKAIVMVTLSTKIVVDVPDEFVPSDECEEDMCQTKLFKHLMKCKGLLTELVFDKEPSVSVEHYGWNSTVESGDLTIKKDFIVKRSR